MPESIFIIMSTYRILRVEIGKEKNKGSIEKGWDGNESIQYVKKATFYQFFRA
jgi:hypothetical protein